MADALSDHISAADPHVGYVKESDFSGLGDIPAGNGSGTSALSGANHPGGILVNVPNEAVGLQWQTITEILTRLLSHKGDIMTADGFGNIYILPVGTDGEIIYADSTVTGGLRWGAAPAGTCPFSLDFSFDCDSGYVAVI